MQEPISIDLYADEAVLVATLGSSFSISTDTAGFISDITQILDTVGRKLFYIVDIRDLRISFGNLLTAANVSARGVGSYLRHPNIREVIIVSADRQVSDGVRGMHSPVFGMGAISTQPSLAEALAYCRQHLAISA